MTQVKICGLTRPGDVEMACVLGADYVGFNFAAASPRRVTLDSARDLAHARRVLLSDKVLLGRRRLASALLPPAVERLRLPRGRSTVARSRLG